MMDLNKLADSYSKSLHFLIDNQQPDGSFFSFSDPQKKPAANQTTFFTSLILDCLNNFHEAKLSSTISQAVAFLVSQKHPSGSFNYWSDKEISINPEHYPDDLDDTACALAALFPQKLVTEADLAKFTKILLHLEIQPGGPYYTWLVQKIKNTKWADIDLVVNINTAYFLSLLDIKLAPLDTFLTKSIISGSLASPYYHAKFASFYFLSRFYHGPAKQKLIDQITTANQTPFTNPLDAALLGLALFNLTKDGSLIEKNIRFLLVSQSSEGSFGHHPFIIERIFGDHSRLAEAPALTTALALNLYSCYLKNDNQSSFPAETNKSFESVVLKRAEQLFKPRVTKEFLKTYRGLVKTITKNDLDGQITLHPYLFTQSLKQICPANINLPNLSAAGLFGWLAYTIFDNISDEQKDLGKLPLAAFCLRELDNLYCADNPHFRPTYEKIMDQVDLANLWEAQHLRLVIKENSFRIPKSQNFSDPQKLADKSIAHCLGPLAVLFSLGYDQPSPEFSALLNFYQNYLAARQLNDDAHDWSDDLSRGQLNYASEKILVVYQQKFGRLVNLKTDLPKLRQIFWDQIIIEICQDIFDLLNNARANLYKLNHLLNQDYLAAKLSQLDNSARKALSERDKTLTYLAELFTT